MYTHEGHLRRHVRESNAIEGVYVKPGHPFYDDHLAAVRIADHGEIVDPNLLHKRLLGRMPLWLHRAGCYRRHDVFIISGKKRHQRRRGGIKTRAYTIVGKKLRQPSPRHVPMLMDIFHGLVKEYEQLPKSDRRLSAMAWYIHAFFLCIHPYEDGNGRTARLILNMLLRNKGLPWHTQSARKKGWYYARIKAFERDLFRPDYPNVYN